MTTAHAGEVATRRVRRLPAFIAAFVGRLVRRLPAFIAAFVGRLVRDRPAFIAALVGRGPMPPLPRDHHGPGPFMRRRSQQKRRKLARRGGR